MKYFQNIKALVTVMAIMLTPFMVFADPASPPDGDPYAAPVNGGLVVVVVLAFIYGGYRIYKSRIKYNDFKINR